MPPEAGARGGGALPGKGGEGGRGEAPFSAGRTTRCARAGNPPAMLFWWAASRRAQAARPRECGASAGVLV